SVPFTAWHGLAWIAERLPVSQLSRSQVELMEVDTAASPGLPGLEALDIAPTPMEAALEQILAKR
ncbi:MAG: complex I NDUFA9 subunit family protein, partial [Rhodomicrobium sp.]